MTAAEVKMKLNEIYAKLGEAENIQQAWSAYNTITVNEKLKEQKAKATETALAELTKLETTMEADIKELEKDIDAKLFPMKNSIERELATHEEERAFRVVQVVTKDKFEKEIERAVNAGEMDYTSHLLKYANLIFDGEKQASYNVGQIQFNYEKYLDVISMKDQHSQKKQVLRDIQARIKTVGAGYTRNLDNAKDGQELTAMLMVAGLSQ